MRIAMNVADLTRYDEIIRMAMIAPVIAKREIINAGPNMDDSAVVLDCSERRGRAILEYLRTIVDAKAGQYKCRAYAEGPKGGWKKI